MSINIKDQTPEQIASELYNTYAKKFTSGLMYIDSEGEIMLDAVECAIMAIELAIEVCPEGTFNNPNKNYMKLTEALEILKSKL